MKVKVRSVRAHLVLAKEGYSDAAVPTKKNRMERNMENTTSFYKKVIVLILPIALQNLINVGISSIDVIMLGRVGENVLSGASLGSQINFIMSLFLFGLMSGASVLIAQYWGKKDMESIKTVFGIAMKISAVIGIVFLQLHWQFPVCL